MGQALVLERGVQVQAHMSDLWGQAWISAAPAGTATTTNGPMNESGLTSVLLLTGVLLLTSVLLPKSALLIESVMPIATGKIVALRTKKAQTGKYGQSYLSAPWQRLCRERVKFR